MKNLAIVTSQPYGMYHIHQVFQKHLLKNFIPIHIVPDINEAYNSFNEYPIKMTSLDTIKADTVFDAVIISGSQLESWVGEVLKTIRYKKVFFIELGYSSPSSIEAQADELVNKFTIDEAFFYSDKALVNYSKLFKIKKVTKITPVQFDIIPKNLPKKYDVAVIGTVTQEVKEKIPDFGLFEEESRKIFDTENLKTVYCAHPRDTTNIWVDKRVSEDTLTVAAQSENIFVYPGSLLPALYHINPNTQVFYTPDVEMDEEYLTKMKTVTEFHFESTEENTEIKTPEREYRTAEEKYFPISKLIVSHIEKTVDGHSTQCDTVATCKKSTCECSWWFLKDFK